MENMNEEIEKEFRNGTDNGGEEAAAKYDGPIEHEKILTQLIKHVQEVDLYAEAKLEQGEKLGEKHLLIITVDQTLKAAQQYNWDLCMHNNSVYAFNGEFWAKLEMKTLQWFLERIAERLGVKRTVAIYYSFQQKLVRQFLAQCFLPKPVKNREIVQINMKNGTYEITPEGSRLRDFDKKDFLTYQLPFSFDPDAKAEMFQGYLDRVLPDKSSQLVLGEYLGYLFVSVKRLKTEKILCLYGEGANGKSVLFDIIREMVGSQNVTSFSLKSLSNENGYFRAKLENCLVNWVSEISSSAEAETLKKLASVEPLEARLPYGQPFVMEDYGKQVYNANVLPRDVEATNAYFRRWLIIPFNVTIPDAEQDKQFAQKIIKAELSGVFNWVLQGLNRLLSQNDFTECEAAREQLKQYRAETDTVRMFLDDSGYEAHIERHIAAKHLSSQYTEFCREGRFKPLNHTNFLKRLRALGIQTEKRNFGQIVFVQQKAHDGPNAPSSEPSPLSLPSL